MSHFVPLYSCLCVDGISQALEMQIRELEERKRAFEQEKHEWESTNGITVDELKRRSLEANSKE